jgi:transcriptional regulator with XRE-family HTH domain
MLYFRQKRDGEGSDVSDAATLVGRNVKRIRQERGLGQIALSEYSGVAQSTISNLEGGKHLPHRATLRKLAEALGVDAGVFIMEAAEEQARELLTRAWANVGVLEHHMANPPDEATFDRALDEFWAIGSRPLELTLQIIEGAKADGGQYDKDLLADLIRAEMALMKLLPRVEKFNFAQYGHRHKAAG